MREGRSLQDLATELQRQRQNMRDFKSPTHKIILRADVEVELTSDRKSLEINTYRFNTNQLFLKQLAGWAGIPQKYVEKMRAEAPGLLSDNVNYWLQDNHNEIRLIRTLDGTARAFLSNSYRMLDNVDVVETVLPIFAERGITSVSSEVTPDHLYLKAVNERRTIEVRKGDPVQIGVVISNSEVGHGAVHVDPLIYRLACLNGAIIADAGMRKFHIGRRLQELEDAVEVFKDDTVRADNRAFFLKLRDVVNAAFDETQMDDLLRSITEGTRRRLGDGKPLDEVVELTATRCGLTSPESDSVLRHLIEGRDLTQWGLANAVTAASQQPVLDYERATELERIGGNIMVLDETKWKELVN